jgi:glycosyltransferase involved in cell wall biosynthesis
MKIAKIAPLWEEVPPKLYGGTERVVTAVRKTGWRLKMAAKIASHELDYWKTSIEPLVNGDQIQYFGELGHDAKCELIRGAAAMLFPIQWKEPFGLVMVESLACRTPVVAWRNGSVPEIIQLGRTGFIVNSINEMVNAIARIPEISREDCRVDAETRFSNSRMAQDYLEVYDTLIVRDSLSNAPMIKLEAAD